MGAYYKDNEWNIVDIVYRLFTHKYYTNNEGKIILILKEGKEDLYISVLGISKDLYGTGITDKVFNDLSKLKFKYLTGHISENNKHSLRMVKRIGFQVVGIEDNYYKDSHAFKVRKVNN